MYLLLTTGDHLLLTTGDLVLLAEQEASSVGQIIPLANRADGAGTNPTVTGNSLSVALVNASGTLVTPATATCSVYRLGGTLARTAVGTVNAHAVTFTVLDADYDEFDVVLVRFTADDVVYPASGYLHVVNPN